MSFSNVRLVLCNYRGKGRIKKQNLSVKESWLALLICEVHLLQAVEMPSYLNCSSSALFGSPHRSEEQLLLSQGECLSRESYLVTPNVLGGGGGGLIRTTTWIHVSLENFKNFMKMNDACNLATQAITLALAVQGRFCGWC